MDKKFYTDLKFFFKKNGITQEYLANILSISQPNLNAMLNGRRSISKPTAVKLHELYGLSVSWLLAGDGNMIDESTTNTVNFHYFLTSFNKKAPNLTVRCQNKNVTLKKTH